MPDLLAPGNAASKSRTPQVRKFDAAEVEARLEAAGRTLWRLPDTGLSPAGFHNLWSYEGRAFGHRVARPSGREIDEADTAYAWLNLIPDQRERMIVLNRTTINPKTGRRRYSWRELASVVSLSPEGCRKIHRRGIQRIVVALAHQAAVHTSSQPSRR